MSAHDELSKFHEWLRNVLALSHDKLARIEGVVGGGWSSDTLEYMRLNSDEEELISLAARMDLLKRKMREKEKAHA